MNTFDGIWASASLLHCAKSEMNGVLKRIGYALKPQGIVYMSFKHGVGERVDEKGRLFNDYTEAELMGLLDKQINLTCIDFWIESKPLRRGWQTWVNVLAKREAD